MSERYSWAYRTEVLNAYLFGSLEQVCEVSTDWLKSYNGERPHGVLAGLPPPRIGLNLKTEIL